MNEKPTESPILRISSLETDRPTEFCLQPDAGARKSIAVELDLLALRKLRFQGTVAPVGDADWLLTAELGATVVQPCVLTLEPVTTRLDVPVSRRFVAGFAPVTTDEEEETEMPEDDSIEPLGREIDLFAVMTEALSLALPLYPRAAEAELEETTFSEPGTEPMKDEDLRPFAGLASLRDKLDKNGE